MIYGPWKIDCQTTYIKLIAPRRSLQKAMAHGRTFHKLRLSGMVYLEANEFQEKWVTKMRGFAAAAF